MATRHQFWVLTGPDYAGKSSVMANLAERHEQPWHYVSYDDRFMPGDAGLARRIRADVESSLPSLIRRYSTDFALTLIQSAVVFLRDESQSRLATGPVLLDSYYYKMLTKCRLLGLVNEQFFTWWRSFPQPDHVVYLDVAPAVAWRRSGAGQAVNALETRGTATDRTAFEQFQVQLGGALRAELRGCPMTVVDAGDGVDGREGIDSAARAVGQLMRSVHV